MISSAEQAQSARSKDATRAFYTAKNVEVTCEARAEAKKRAEAAKPQEIKMSGGRDREVR